MKSYVKSSLKKSLEHRQIYNNNLIFVGLIWKSKMENNVPIICSAFFGQNWISARIEFHSFQTATSSVKENLLTLEDFSCKFSIKSQQKRVFFYIQLGGRFFHCRYFPRRSFTRRSFPCRFFLARSYSYPVFSPLGLFPAR